MSIWKLILNAGTVFSVLRSVEGIFERAIKEKRPPGKADFKELLQDGQKLFASGLIDIPGVDEADIVKSLKEIEDQL